MFLSVWDCTCCLDGSPSPSPSPSPASSSSDTFAISLFIIFLSRSFFFCSCLVFKLSSAVFGPVIPPATAKPAIAPWAADSATPSSQGLSSAQFWAICSCTDWGSSSNADSAIPALKAATNAFWVFLEASLPTSLAAFLPAIRTSISSIPTYLAALPPSTPNIPVNTPLPKAIVACPGVNNPCSVCCLICSACCPAAIVPSPSAAALM